MRLAVKVSSAICAALASMGSVAVANAQSDFPSRPVRVVVGFPAGSGADIGVRFIAARLQEVSRATIVVENKPGAGSNIAIEQVARAKPDGYTLLFAASSAMAGSRFLYKDFKLDTENEFAPVATLWQSIFVLTVAPQSPVSTVAELTALLKSKPKTLHAYTNQTGQIAAAAYLAKVGATSQSVSYRAAADAVADLGSGTLDFMMLDGAFSAGQMRAGRVKPLAVTAARRSTSTPDTPTMQEAGLADFAFAPFWAAYFPKGTPPEIVARMSVWLIEVVKLDATRQQYHTTGSTALGEGPDQVRAELRSEIGKWAEAVKLAGVVPQ